MWPHDPIKLKLTELFAQLPLFKNLSSESLPAGIQLTEIILKSFSNPPDLKLGDLAFGGFQFAKILKQNPAQFILRLKVELESQGDPAIESVSAAGPYLNLKLSDIIYQIDVLDHILSNGFINTPKPKDLPKTMVEYSSLNTHKEVHVGHMRNMCLGDSLCRILKFVGYPIISSTFPGDVGTHVAKCLWYLKFQNKEPIPELNKGTWLGLMYSKGSLLLEDQEKTHQGEANKKILTEILKQLECQKGEYFDLWQETRQWSIDLLNSVYTWAQIQIDKWYWESEVDAPSVEWVKKLHADGFLQTSEGAIGLDLSEQDLGFCLLIKSDGNGLYATKDLELARRKFQDYQIEKSIYVVDVRQALHFKQVFAVLKHIGFEQSKDCFHLSYNFLELPDGPMSSRKGNIVPLMQLVEAMEAHIKKEYLSRYEKPEMSEGWTPELIQNTARDIARGAIRYGMLKQDPNKKIIFDQNEWLKLDGDTGPYIQYTYARLSSVVRKSLADTKTVFIQTSDGYGFNNFERDVMMHLSQFYLAVWSSSQQNRPSILCNYVFDLAQKLNAFYHECPILSSEGVQKKLRLQICEASKSVLAQGLDLLGIPTVEKM